MLVLSRKAGEKIMIGDDIEIVVLRISGSTVRLGIKAPPEILIHRQELKEAMQAALGADSEVEVEIVDLPADGNLATFLEADADSRQSRPAKKGKKRKD